MKLYYLTRWRYFKIMFNNRFGQKLNARKIKTIEKKLHRNNKKLDVLGKKHTDLEKKNRKLAKELQNAYFRDSMEKMRKEGRI